MIETQHFLQRAHNRGITNMELQLVRMYGYQKNDCIILDKKQTRDMLDEVNKLRKVLINIYEKGGISMVVRNNSLITTYPINRRINKKKAKYHV